MAKFESAIPLPEYELQYEEMACTPYRRPPFSFVTDGFLVIGDAACLTKPINGEGIPSAWVQCTPAADIVASALEDGGYPTKEKLWLSLARIGLRNVCLLRNALKIGL